MLQRIKENKFQDFPEVEVRLEQLQPRRRKEPIDTMKKAADYVTAILGEYTVENIVVVMVDAKTRPICHAVVARGSVNTACFSIAEILRIAILCNAVGVFCFHNHPSGDPSPSKEDDRTAESLSFALQMLQFALYDFIIVGGQERYSYREEKRGPYRDEVEAACAEGMIAER